MNETPFVALGARRWWHCFLVTLQFSYRSVIVRKASWFGTLVFAGCLLVLYPFAFGTEIIQRVEIRYGAFWIINEFVVALTVLRLFSAEQEAGALELALASRSPRSAILCGKMAFGALQLLSLQVPMTILWFLFYNVPLPLLLPTVKMLLPVCVLFSLGTSSLGALINCVTARSLAREILVPILFYPLQIGLLLASVTICVKNDAAQQFLGAFSEGAWWSILMAFPVIFTSIGFLLGDELLQE